MEIKERKRKENMLGISGIYKFDQINDLYDVDKILKALELSGATIGEIEFTYEFDEADYKPTIKYANYEEFLKKAGLVTPTESLESIDFKFQLNDKKLNGSIGLSGNALIIRTNKKLTDDPSIIFEYEETAKQAENIIENIDSIVK